VTLNSAEKPGVDEPGLVGDGHCLRFLSDSEFHHSPVEVGFHGGLADEQMHGDVGIGQA
jgi:hypothetical protein